MIKQYRKTGESLIFICDIVGVEHVRNDINRNGEDYGAVVLWVTTDIFELF